MSDGLAHLHEAIVIGGLALFGLMFAVNSSLHSYLVLAYAGSKKAAEDVGFYYSANAAGRLIGTLLSGLLFQAILLDAIAQGIPGETEQPRGTGDIPRFPLECLDHQIPLHVLETNTFGG